jgi:hypothetical protein
MIQQRGPAKGLPRTQSQHGYREGGGVQFNIHAAGSDQVEVPGLLAIYHDHFVHLEGDFRGD